MVETRISRSTRWWIPILVTVVVIVGIGVFQAKFVSRDCGWTAYSRAWIDENGNGVRDEGEPPLLDVEFHVNDTLNEYDDVGWGPSISNWKGESSVYVWLPGCPRARFEVYAVPPPGYRLTTDSPIPAKGLGYGNEGPFDFGLTYLPGVPTATPRPSDPLCTSYDEMLQSSPDSDIPSWVNIVDLAQAADGSIWVATYGAGVMRWNSATGDWKTYRVEDGLVSDQVTSITVADDDVIWFATNRGVSRFESSTWTSFTSDDGLIDDSIYAIAIDQDETAWFATPEGVSALDQSTSTWTNYTQADGLADDFNQYVGATPDGSVWAASLGSEVARFVPS